MKAISVKQPWASLIACGKKMIETRTWYTNDRGDILIASSRLPKVGTLPLGYALCIARLHDCRKMTKADEVEACCEMYTGAYAWVFSDIFPIKPFGVKGKLGIYEVSEKTTLI